MILTGKKTVSGVANGLAFVLPEQELIIEQGEALSADVEIKRLAAAFEKAREELKEIHSKVSQEIGSAEAEIIDAHLMMLEDPEFLETIQSKIQSQKYYATLALHEASEEMAQIFESMNNEYMTQRGHDVRDIASRVMHALNGFNGKIDLPPKCILVAQELKPSVLSSLDHKNIAGILTSIDGRNSHTAILARSLDIPTMMGVSGVHSKMATGDMVGFISDEEKIYHKPSLEEQALLDQALNQWLRLKQELLQFKDLKTTYQSERVHLEANINSLQELNQVKASGAEGIGLFRTEFIYMDRKSAPTEEEQFKIYSEVLSAVAPLPCTIRTLDVGGDKDIPYLGIIKEENPFLGLRAIRYCLKNPAFFKVQLRALLRASVLGNLKIMIPMITTLEEVRETKKLLKEVESELMAQNIPFGAYKFGIMVEVPAVAIMASEFAKEVDFFSLGTNDLTQYVCAVDRMNESIKEMYDSHHPAVLSLIGQTIKAAREAHIGVSVCGEMAGQPAFTSKLLELGLRTFSMSSVQILPMRKLLEGL